MSDALTLSRADLARLLGVTPPVIGTALDEGAPGAHDRGGPGKAATIEVAPFLRWWIQRAVQRGGGAGGKLTDVERKLDIDLKREKLARERSEFVPRAALAEVTRDAFTRVRITVERMESRHAESFVLLPDVAAASAALVTLGESILSELRAPATWDDEPRAESIDAADTQPIVE